MSPSDGSEQCPITGKMCMVLSRNSEVSQSVLAVPAHGSLPSQGCTVIALIQRLLLTRNSAFTHTSSFLNQ